MTPADPTTPALDPVTPAPPASPILDLLAEPTFEECVTHHSRYFTDVAAGRLSFDGIPEGHHIAYYEGRIHDHDADPTALTQRVAAALGVHWARVFIHYPWPW